MSREGPSDIFVTPLRWLVVSVDSRAHLLPDCSVLEYITLWSVGILFILIMSTALAESEVIHPWLFL